MCRSVLESVINHGVCSDGWFFCPKLFIYRECDPGVRPKGSGRDVSVSSEEWAPIGLGFQVARNQSFSEV
ncbi:MAG: hypothetical protein Marn2KO_15550 [Marinobacter nauticus]